MRDSCAGAVPFVSTSVTARSARELAGSADPGRREASAPPPWPSGPGCLRAAEPAALATAVTPSFAGRRLAEPRRHLTARTGRRHRHLSCVYERENGPYLVRPAAGTVPGAGPAPRRPPAGSRTTLGGVGEWLEPRRGPRRSRLSGACPGSAWPLLMPLPSVPREDSPGRPHRRRAIAPGHVQHQHCHVVVLLVPGEHPVYQVLQQPGRVLDHPGPGLAATDTSSSRPESRPRLRFSTRPSEYSTAVVPAAAGTRTAGAGRPSPAACPPRWCPAAAGRPWTAAAAAGARHCRPGPRR